MAQMEKNESGLGMPVTMMLILGLTGAVVVALCFVLVKYWPLPVSVAPYFGWKDAFAWGGIAGGLTGLLLGHLLDDRHFERTADDK